MVRRHVLRAANNPISLDDRQVNAVAARIELDLRLGASFTRFQTLTLQLMGGDLAERVISYGSLPESMFYTCTTLTRHRVMPIPYTRFCR